MHIDGSVSIKDNGRGIPVDMHPKFKMPAVELVLPGGSVIAVLMWLYRRHKRIEVHS